MQARSSQKASDSEVTSVQRTQQILQAVAALRHKHKAPSPVWIVAAPLAQVNFRLCRLAGAPQVSMQPLVACC